MKPETERLATALAGRYRVERELGAGGMATVYLAHDPRHEREVALKVLRPELAAAIGSERFLQEIRLTANLQHPHILALFDSGEADGFLYYVMPFVQGESLRGRLDREKQLPVADAVRIATEVANALDYAHRHGVIHRDVKPENVLLHDGHALVADFGIALAVQAAGGPRLTATGLSLGTPLYMSPEQASGAREIDQRTDVYSLGVLLYEMLAGEPPHTGPTAQAVIAAVMADEPRPITALRKTVPPRVAAVVEVALQKLPADRFPGAAALAEALDADAKWPGVAAPAPAAAGTAAWIRDWRSWIAAGVAAGAVVAALLRGGGNTPAAAPPARFTVAPPGVTGASFTDVASLAISPDGTMLVYSAVPRDSGRRGQPQLFARALDEIEPLPIQGTVGAAAPFFSPDGQWVGFWRGARLMKVRVTGGEPVTLADSTKPFFLTAASWGPHGRVVFPIGGSELATVNEAGGAPRVLYQDSTMIVSAPSILPDGRHVMFLRCHPADCGQRQEIAVVDLVTHAVRALTAPGVYRVAQYLPPGYLLFVRGDLYVNADADLMAAPFDARRGFTGEAVPVMEHVQSFAISRTGTLVTVDGPAEGSELTVVRLDGTARPLASPPRQYMYLSLSPDGRRVAAEIHDAAGGQIWTYDTTSRTLTRLTTTGHNSQPAWSPDGRSIAFSSARDTASGIYILPADGSRPEQRIGIASPDIAFAEVSWSPDGGRVAYDVGGAERQAIYTVRAMRDSVPQRIQLPPGASDPVISPDGRWMAYMSSESRRREVYVRPYPGPGGRWQVSANGGSWPVWAHSGRELFYIGADNWLYAVTLSLGQDVKVARRARLFDTGPYYSYSYAVFPDDRHFLFIRAARGAPEVHVTLNWLTELRQRLQGGQRKR